MPGGFNRGVFSAGAGAGNQAQNARLMDQYARMAERGLNVERQRASVLEGLNRMERDRLRIASQNYDRIRESTQQMRQQNAMLRESYSSTGLQARATERVANLHGRITESLSLENMISKSLGTLWETQVARGMKIASKVIANISDSTENAVVQTEHVTAAFRDLSDTSRRLALNYHEDFAEINALHNEILANMRFTVAEIDAGSRGAEGLVRHFNQSLATLTEIGILTEDLKGTLDFAQEAAQLGHSYTETAGGIAVTIKMVEKLAKSIKKGPNAELTNFDHILRDKVIKDVRKLFTEFGGINTSVVRLTALMVTAGTKALAMGATIAEASQIQGAAGNYFANTHGRGEDMNFLEGERIRQSMGLARRGANGQMVEDRRRVRGQDGREHTESDDEMLQRVLAANPNAYGASVTPEQREQRLRRMIRMGHSNQQMTANIGAAEEFGGTAAGVNAIASTARDLVSGRLGGGGAPTDRSTQAELLMERFHLQTRMQGSMMQDMIEHNDLTGLEGMIREAQEAAHTNEQATDPVAQGRAIQETSRNMGELVKLANVGNKTLQENMDRIVANLASVAGTMVPGGLFSRLYAHVTGDTSRENAATAPRTQAAATAAEVAAGGNVASAGVVTGAIDERTGSALARSGVRQARAASLDYDAAYGATARGMNRDTADDVGGALGLHNIARDIRGGDYLSAAGGILPRIMSPIGMIGTAIQGVSELTGTTGPSADAYTGNETEAVRRTNAQIVRQFRTTFDDAAATRLERELQGAHSQAEASRIVAAAREREERSHPVNAPSIPGGAPSPVATPSATQAAAANNASHAAAATTSAGTAGTRGTGTIETLPNGKTRLTTITDIDGMPNVIAANLAAAQSAAGLP